MPRVLVIHPGALGDVLLAVPALRALRGAARETTVVLAAQSHVGALLRAVGEVDAAVRFEGLGLEALFSEEPRPDPPALAGFDSIVSWFGSGDARFAGRLRALAPAAVVAPSVAPDRGVWEYLLATIGAKDEDDLRAPFLVPTALLASARQALTEAGWDGETPLVVAHPGAGSPAKRWGVEGFAEVLGAVRTAHGVAIVVHEGPADAEPARALRRALGASALALAHPSLPVLAGALAHAAAYVGNDSGVSHLAAATGVPAVVLFTPTMLRWRPWSPSAACLGVGSRTVAEDAATVRRALALALARVPAARR